MRKEKQDAKRRLIEEAAYEILTERGYRSSSMLLIAKKAKASNETLYRWYGSKQGLFSALAVQNAQNVSKDLDACEQTSGAPLQTLQEFGSTLLGLLTSERTIALNRAAAAEAENKEEGEKLGEVVADTLHKVISPRLTAVIKDAQDQGLITSGATDRIQNVYLALLTGDLAIRGTIGASKALPKSDCDKRAAEAQESLVKLYGCAA